MFVISDWDYKSMQSIAFIFNVKLSKHRSVSRKNSKVSNPPLRSLRCGTVHDKWLWSLVIGSSSHQTLDVWSVPKFCLSIAADDLTSFGRLQQRLNLLFVAEISQSRQKHHFMEAQWHLFLKEQSLLQDLYRALRHDFCIADKFFCMNDHEFFSGSVNMRWVKA